MLSEDSTTQHKMLGGTTGFAGATFLESAQMIAWQKAIQNLNALRSLERNWDGAGAPAVPRSLIAFSLTILDTLKKLGMSPPSRILPTPAGTVAVEWQGPRRYIELEIEKVGELEWMIEHEDETIEHSSQHVEIIGDRAMRAL